MVESPQKSYTSSRAVKTRNSWLLANEEKRARDTQSVEKLSLTNFKVLKKKTAEKLIWAQGRQWRNLHFQTHRKKSWEIFKIQISEIIVVVASCLAGANMTTINTISN